MSLRRHPPAVQVDADENGAGPAAEWAGSGRENTMAMGLRVQPHLNMMGRESSLVLPNPTPTFWARDQTEPDLPVQTSNAAGDEGHAADTQDPLCIGDIITLYDDHNRGFIGSHLSAIHDGALTVDSSPNGGSRPIGRDVSEVLFQVQAAERYKCTKRYRAMLEQYKRLHEAETKARDMAAEGIDGWKDDDADDAALESLLIASNTDLRNMKAKADQEVDDNNDMQVRLFGEPLYYGQQIELLHVRSRNHIEADAVAPALLEPENMRVNLRNTLHRNISFTVEPMFKVRSKGERVRQGDKVVLQSVKVMGQYLHTAPRMFSPSHYLAGEHELNLSVVKTMYTVKVFLRASNVPNPVKPPPPLPLTPVIPTPPILPTQQIRGGDVVQLFHRELDGYVAAEKAFVDTDPQNIIGQDVHLRIRKPDAERPHRLSPPTSAVSFWRIELESQLSGAAVEYNTKVRFRHLLTGHYLGIDEDRTIDEEKVTGTAANSRELQIVLVPVNKDTPAEAIEGTLFSLAPVANDTGSDVYSGMMARLLHCKTGCWVHGADGSVVERTSGVGLGDAGEFNDFQDRLGGIKWDQAPLCNVSVVHELLFEDAYQVSVVSDSLVSDAAFIADTQTILSHFVRSRRMRELTPMEYELTRTTLLELRNFMYINGLSQRTRQKLLRNYCIIDLLVSMLRVPFRPDNTSEYGIELKDLASNRELNETITMVFPVLKAYLDGPSRKNELYASRYIALFFTKMGGYMNVEPLVIEMIRDNHKIISHVGEKEVAYINSFVAQGSRDPDFLELIAVLCACDGVPLRLNQTLSSELLLQGDMNVFYPMRSKGDEVVVSSAQGAAGSWKLVELLEQDIDESKWLEKQVDLLAKLCTGRFDYAIDCITKTRNIISADICFRCAQNMNITHSLRTAYVELLIAAFIDVRPHEPALDFMQAIPLASLKAGHRHSVAARSAQGFLVANLARMDEWIVSVLQMYDGLIVSETASNSYLKSVLRLLARLVRFGVYKSKESITRIIEPLLSLVDGADDLPAPQDDHQNDHKQKRLQEEHVAEWRRTGRFEENRDNKVAVDVKIEALTSLEHLLNQQHFLKVRQLVLHMRELTEWSRAEKSTVFTGTMSTDLAPKFKSYLVDVTDDAAVAQTHRVRKYLKSIHANFDFVLNGWQVGDSIEKSIIATLCDLAQYQFSVSLRKSMMMITKIFRSSERMLEDASKMFLLTETISVQFLNGIQPLIHNLIDMSSGYIEEGESANYCKILTLLESKLAVVGAPGVPHRVNQHILFSAGVMHILLDVLDYDDGQRVDVLISTFSLLRKICWQNPDAQGLLFTKLDMLLHIKSDTESDGPAGWENALAAAVAEMFRDNERVCLNVTQSQIHAMTTFLAEYNTHVPAMLDAMRATVRAGGVVLKRNQRILVKDLCNTEKQHRCLEPALMMLRMDDSKRVPSEEWISKINSLYVSVAASGNAEEPTYVYHLKMIELVAACCEDSQKFISSMCRSMLPLDVILAIFGSPNSPPLTSPSMRALFLRYIRAVFADDKAIGIGQSTRFWNCLIFSATQDMAVPGSAHDARAQEDYVFDAFLPLLVDIIKVHYKPQRYPQIVPLHDKVMARVLPVVEACVPHVNQRKHLLAVNELFFLLSKSENLLSGATRMAASGAMRETRIRMSSLDTSSDHVAMEHPQEYIDRYREQDALNAVSKTYFRNLLRSYRGRNEAHVQLGVLGDHVMSRLSGVDSDDDYCEEEGSDEYLPLGSDFQHFTMLFGSLGSEDGASESVRKQRIRSFARAWDESNQSFGQLSALDLAESEIADIYSVQAVRACLHNQALLKINRSAMQKELCELGVTPVLMKMMRRPAESLVRESLALQVQIMSEGNHAAQETAKSYFVHTREEDFFDQVNCILQDSSDGFENQRSINKQVRLAHEIESRLESLAQAETTRPTNGSLKTHKGHFAQHGSTGMLFENLDDSDFSQASMDSGASLPSRSKKNQIVPVDKSKQILAVKENPPTSKTGVKPIAELSVRVLQLLCEGHNNFLQNYLRDQEDNIRSINLVTRIAKFFGLIVQDVRGGTVTLINQILETLTEMAGGCSANQKAIVDENIVNELSALMRMSPRAMVRRGVERVDAAKIHYNCAVLIETLLESADERTATQAVQMSETLDLSAVCDRLLDYYTTFEAEEDKQWDFDGDEDPLTSREVAYEMHRVLLMMEDQTGIDYSNDHETGKKHQQGIHTARAALNKYSLSVEIVRDGVLQKVHFEAPEQWRLTKQMKHELVWNVNRDSAIDKIRDFVERARTFENDIAYLKGCEQSSFVLAGLIRYARHVRLSVLAITFLINLLILVAWEANDGDLGEVEPTTPDWYPMIFIVLASLHMALSALLVAAFYTRNPLSLQLTFETIPVIGARIAGRLAPPLTECTRQSLFSGPSLYHLAFLAASGLGFVYHGYFFCFHLLHIIVGNDILGRVVKSVTQNYDSLLWVMLLMIIIIYIYSLVAFAFLRDTFTPEEGEWCDTEWQCFATSVRLGLLNGGGLGESLETGAEEGATPALRSLFDVSFFVIITVIALNVVFGIIVDTFSELREEKYAIRDAMENECFICSRKRSEFEQKSKGFKHHTKHEHNMWAYVHFLMYVRSKNPTLFTSHEHFFYDALDDETAYIEAFPINRARCLNDEGDSGLSNEELGAQLGELMKRMDEIASQLRSRPGQSRPSSGGGTFTSMVR